MPVRHPLAERDAAPAAVTVGTTTYPVRDGIVDCPPDREDAVAEAVADAHDVPREAVYEEDGPPDDECGYYDPDTMDSPCSRPAGWGRDAADGRCQDHID